MICSECKKEKPKEEFEEGYDTCNQCYDLCLLCKEYEDGLCPDCKKIEASTFREMCFDLRIGEL